MIIRSLLAVLCGWLFAAKVEADTIWEFDPYRVQLWLSVDPSANASPSTVDGVLESIREQFDITFGGTCDVHIETSPPHLRTKLTASLRGVTLNDLQVDDLVLVIAKEQGSSIRSAQAAFEKLEKIVMLAGPYANFQSESAMHSDDESLKGVKEKIQPWDGSFIELVASFKEGKTEAALVNRSQVEKLKEYVRQISVRFPWQVESIVRSFDKLMLANLSKRGEAWVFEVRELDCAMRWMGPCWVDECAAWESLPRTMIHTIRRAFTPISRIEQADAKVARLRVRAAGLATHDDHPILIQPGDVVMPMVRRSDRAGSDATLQSIPWTYVAITDGDRINLRGSIYSGIRGALQGRQNKRIQRLAMVVKTPEPSTDLLLLGMNRTIGASEPGKGNPVPGVAVYERIPSRENLDLLGRSDWRGIVSLPTREPPTIEYEVLGNSTEVQNAEANPEAVGATESGTEVDRESTEALAASAAKSPAKNEPLKKTIQLHVPLYLYYVKNGDVILARLPIVHGMQAQEVAELPDDSRRLEAEALLRGLQGEIIDVVARRKIFEMKIDKRIKDDRIEDARNCSKTFDRFRPMMRSMSD